MSPYPFNSLRHPVGSLAIKFACRGCGSVAGAYCCDGKGRPLPQFVSVNGGAPITLAAFFDTNARGGLELEEIREIIDALATDGVARIGGGAAPLVEIYAEPARSRLPMAAE